MSKPFNVIVSKVTNPFVNVAIEDWLLRNSRSPHLLFLWRNDTSVILGYRYDVDRQTEPESMEGGSVSLVAKALRSLSLPAVVNSRFDIVIDSKKVSGSAYKLVNSRAYHHGTMLIDSNLENLLLTLSPAKKDLVGGGIESVRSSVTRLQDHVRAGSPIGYLDFYQAVIDEFQAAYGNPLEEPVIDVLDEQSLSPEIRQQADTLASLDWVFGQTPKFTLRHPCKDDRGQVWCELVLRVEHSIIQECIVEPKNSQWETADFADQMGRFVIVLAIAVAAKPLLVGLSSESYVSTLTTHAALSSPAVSTSTAAAPVVSSSSQAVPHSAPSSSITKTVSSAPVAHPTTTPYVVTPNWETCTNGVSKCGYGYTCCVAPADVCTGKTTCRLAAPAFLGKENGCVAADQVCATTNAGVSTVYGTVPTTQAPVATETPCPETTEAPVSSPAPVYAPQPAPQTPNYQPQPAPEAPPAATETPCTDAGPAPTPSAPDAATNYLPAYTPEPTTEAPAESTNAIYSSASSSSLSYLLFGLFLL
ncbi:hypothetical protein HDU91_000472 [Kappamyces sp. JEL0680]|nr:hypothetical protein HDU91_000472 [Kappamyces sp. JEL0680]